MDLSINNQALITRQYVPFSDLKSADAAVQNVARDDFAQMLEAAVSAEAQAGVQDSVANKKAVIDKTDKLFEMCQEFETLLIKNLIKSMRSTIQKTDLIDTGFAGQVYEDMLYDEYAKDYAKNAGFGFAELAYLELSGQRGKNISR